MKRKYERLVEIFRQLGAQDAEGWARSEANEGLPQLERFLFLRGAWTNVVKDTRWIDAHLGAAKEDPGAPLAGVGIALERLLAVGADASDLTEVVRGMQYEVLFAMCYLLDDPTPALDGLAEPPPEVEAIGWGLWAEQDGEPLRRIDAVHEDALGSDPTGGEVRPGVWRTRQS